VFRCQDFAIRLPHMKLHKIRSCFMKHLTAELEENAENVIIDNFCVLSDLCGELKCFFSHQTGRSRPAVRRRRNT